MNKVSDFAIKHAFNLVNSPAVKAMAYGERLATVRNAMQNGTFYELTLSDLMGALEIETTDAGFTCYLIEGVYNSLYELSDALVKTIYDYPIEWFVACTINDSEQSSWI